MLEYGQERFFQRRRNMAFQMDYYDANLAFDKEKGLVRIKDANPRNPYNASKFVGRLNSILDFMRNKADNSPINAYKNAMMADTDTYNAFIESFNEMADQFGYLVGALKVKSLAVYLPDVEAFAKKFEELSKANYSDEDYLKLVSKEAVRFGEAVKTATNYNIATAKQNNIPLENPKNKGKEKV